MKLVGKPVSKGVVIGEILCYEPFKAEPALTYIEKANVEQALATYDEVHKAAKQELAELNARLASRDPEKAKFIVAHTDILCDPEIDREVRELVRGDLMSPDAAVAQVFDNYIMVLGKSKNEMMRERVSDLRDVKNRLLRCWCGEPEQNLSALEKPVIIACDDLYPSDTVSMDRDQVLGIITQVGGATSHTAIIARSYEIPAVLGVSGALGHLCTGATVVLDAVEGEVIIDPTEEDISASRKKAEIVKAELAETKAFLDTVPITEDGHRVSVRLNVAAAEEYELSGAVYTDGSGLFRTEFLFLKEDHLPDEEEQYQCYKKVVLAFEGKPVVLRTLDIGGDKQLSRLELPKEENPFLGLRGLRLCLVRPELFGAQIRAALRASAHGDLRIMMPMVGSLDEVRKAKEFIAEQGRALDEAGIPWNKDVKIGIMIEVPSIALIADLVADEVDFVSIGTNDLCQYLTAADRMNPSVKPYYQEYHPAMFRCLGMIAEEFAKVGKPVGICGELGGDVLAIPALLGLGIDKLSMGLASVAGAKRVIQSVNMDECKTLADKVRGMKTEEEIRQCLVAFGQAHKG